MKTPNFGHSVDLFRAQANNAEGEERSGGVPAWIQLTPGEGLIEGRDGRRFEIDDAQAIVDKAEAYAAENGIRPFLDFNHSTYSFMAHDGNKAAGWIEEFEVREGAIWARVDWTDTGRAAVASREYRYISPAWYARYVDEHGDSLPNPIVEHMLNPGLVNDPNLRLAALNQHQPTEEAPRMNEKILQALGLGASASEADALNSIEALKKASTPDAAAFVPRADYDAAVNKATELESKVAEFHAKAVEDTIADALKRGVITPASADYHRSVCQSADGLKAFRECFGADKAPKVPVVEASKLEGAPAPEAKPNTLSKDEERMAKAAGLTAEQWLAAREQTASINLRGVN